MQGPFGTGKALDAPSRAPYLLLGLLALLSIAIGGTAWMFHLQQKTAFESEVKSRLLAIADGKVRQINEWRQVRLREAHLLMEDPFVLDAFQRVIAGRSSPEDRGRAVGLLSALCRNQLYAGAELVDLQGRVALSAGRRFGDDAHFLGLMRTVLATGDIVQRDLHLTDGEGGPHLGLNVPLRAVPGGAIFGAVMLAIDPQEYMKSLQTWPVPTRTGEVLLVRREGDSVLYLTDLRGRPGSALKIRVPMSRNRVAAVMAINGSLGNLEAQDYLGMPVFAAVRPVPYSAW
jgi:hypothetical protein